MFIYKTTENNFRISFDVKNERSSYKVRESYLKTIDFYGFQVVPYSIQFYKAFIKPTG